jgi:hypothetical protein
MLLLEVGVALQTHLVRVPVLGVEILLAAGGEAARESSVLAVVEVEQTFLA